MAKPIEQVKPRKAKAPPSTTAANGNRGPNGRFGVGNSCAVGNPHAKRAAALRSALFDAVSDADLRAIIKAMVKAAKGGDMMAAREVLDRTIGRPSQSDVLVRLEGIEIALFGSSRQ